MNLATDVLIYAWVGWAVLMLPAVLVLFATSFLIAVLGNKIYTNLKSIYRLECIKHYFEKMEKEGTHAFKIKPDDEGGTHD